METGKPILAQATQFAQASLGFWRQNPPEIAGNGESTSLIIVDLESSGFSYPKIIVLDTLW
jgi:hypothetical protein